MLSIYKVNKKYRKIQKYPIYLKIGAEIKKILSEMEKNTNILNIHQNNIMRRYYKFCQFTKSIKIYKNT